MYWPEDDSMDLLYLSMEGILYALKNMPHNGLGIAPIELISCAKSDPAT